MKATWTLGTCLSLHCPACGANTFKAGWFKTAKTCAGCGQNFEPESGFYAGAIYPMYVMGAVIGGIIGFTALMMGAGLGLSFLCAVGALLLLSPWIFWLARSSFLHANHRFFDR